MAEFLISPGNRKKDKPAIINKQTDKPQNDHSGQAVSEIDIFDEVAL
jgi:hypothetical protein